MPRYQETLARFSTDALAAFMTGCDAGRQLFHPQIIPEHLLLGILLRGHSPAATALEGQGVTAEKVSSDIASAPRPAQGHHRRLQTLSDDAKSALNQARRVDALGRHGLGRITTEHLLLSLLADDQQAVPKLLRRLGTRRRHVRQAVLDLVLQPA